MLRRKRPVIPPEPVVLPEPEAPPPKVLPPVDPAVRTILAGPPSPVRDHLADLLSGQQGIEVFAQTDRAEEVLSSVHNLPLRRRVAVLIDARLPGLHDAGWLIRRLRERVPVLRLFAYAEQPDDPAIEHVALAGVDEVLVVGGPDPDGEVLEAFVRQFHLTPAPQESPVTEDVPRETSPAAAPAIADPPPEPPDEAPMPEPPDEAPAPEPPEETPAPEKRSRFHRRSETGQRTRGAPDPSLAESGSVGTAAERNLERELAAARRAAIERRRPEPSEPEPGAPEADRPE